MFAIALRLFARPRSRVPGPETAGGDSGSVGNRRRAIALASVIVLAVGVGVFDHDLWSPTEPTVAGIVTGMLRGGDLAVPRIHGLPYLEKPPLYYWAAWLLASLRGRLDAGILRLPSAVFGLGSLLSSRLLREVLGVSIEVDDATLVDTWVELMITAIGPQARLS